MYKLLYFIRLLGIASLSYSRNVHSLG